MRLLVEAGLDGLHYREWFDLLTRAGYAVAGKDPLAVFLTQLTRSPVVRKSATPGRYELDRQADQRLKRRIDRLHREYLSATRSHRDADHGRDRQDREAARRGPKGAALAARGRRMIEIRPARQQDAQAVAAIYNHGIQERQATFETRPRRPNEIEGWLEEGRPFLVATDEDDDRRLRPRVAVLGPARVRGGGGARRLRRSRPARQGRRPAADGRARPGRGGRRLPQAHEPRLHHQPRQPGAAQGRRASPRWASRDGTASSTGSGRTRCWWNACSVRPRGGRIAP